MMTEKRNTILVVDDHADNLRLLTGLLGGRDYKVRLAPNGKHALATIDKELPNLILLDIMMPDMDGFAICKQLKADERTAAIPIIFISALDEALDKVKAFSLGAVDYITKPFYAEEVLARVETHLHLRQLQLAMAEKNAELQRALDEINTLRTILPICSFCKNIRNDEGYYEQLESYFYKRSGVDFSHTICPSCALEHYPQIYGKKKVKEETDNNNE